MYNQLIKYTFLIATGLFLNSCTVQIPLQNGNGDVAQKKVVENKPEPRPFFCKTKFLDNGSTVRVFLSIDAGRKLNLLEVSKQFVINYTLYLDYTKGARLASGAVTLTGENVTQDANFTNIWYDIKKPQDKTVLTGVAIFEILDISSASKIETDCFLRFQSGKVSDYFAIFDQSGRNIINRNYVYAQDTIQIKSVDAKAQDFKVVRYKFDFDPALSPLATGTRQATKTLYVDSIFTAKANTPIVLKQEALYNFMRDTSEVYGVGLMAVDARFPKITRPEKLLSPLVYMSTSAEMADIRINSNAKQALDRYWLSLPLGSNQVVAKKTIKAFYQRVEQANKLYTGYKEGWKTDRGMIYIVMGNPAKITRTKDKEIWTYNRQGQFSEVNFTFNKRPNQFIDDHYELLRYAEYQPIWFPAVDQWRNGDMASK